MQRSADLSHHWYLHLNNLQDRRMTVRINNLFLIQQYEIPCIQSITHASLQTVFRYITIKMPNPFLEQHRCKYQHQTKHSLNHHKIPSHSRQTYSQYSPSLPSQWLLQSPWEIVHWEDWRVINLSRR